MYLKPPLVVQYPDSRFEVQALLLHKRGRRRVDVLEGAERDPLHVRRLGGVHPDQHIKDMRRRLAGTTALQSCNTSSAAKEQEGNSAKEDTTHLRSQSTLMSPQSATGGRRWFDARYGKILFPLVFLSNT